METIQSRLSGTRDYAGDDAVALRRARASLEATFQRYGYNIVDPPILERASPFLDRSGETIRRRMYIFSDPGGREICLRPELTIPTCRAYLRTRVSDQEARLAYMGPAFRYDSPEEGRYRQFYQAGVELIGADHRVAADAEILALALDAIERGGAKGLSIVTGDIAILFAFIAGLAVDEVTKARLRRIASRKDATERLMKAAAERVAPPADAAPDELATLLASIGTDKAEKLLSEIYALVDLRHVGGRTPEEIVERLVTRTALSTFEGISRELLEGIATLLEIRGEPAAVLAKVEEHFRTLGVPLADNVLGDCRERLELLKVYRGGADAMTFDVGMHRGLEYYTGFVFEIYASDNPDIGHLCGGGRYDNLLQALGAHEAIPAVGCAIGVDRLLLANESAAAASNGPDAVVVAAGAVDRRECVRVSVALRDAGWSVETELSGRRPKNVVREAVKRGVPHVVFVGEDEIAKGIVLIKRLEEREERPVAVAELAAYVAKAARRP
ncbi:MAG: ATP phosphoribosyltransferase regulatory subunit [Rhizomicrobium sp.]